MDLQSTISAGKIQPSKSRASGKNVRAGKSNSKDTLITREKREFGTSQSANIPLKTPSEKPATKPTAETAGKQSKSSRATADEKKLPAKTRERLKRTNATLQGKVPESPEKNAGHGPRTPAAKPKASRPYHTAENCGKCRSDRLETAAYWLAQIKLSESAGKHFASLAFFRLALECKAEPIGNMRNEVKRYLGRHGHLLGFHEWEDVNEAYGLMKDVRQLHQKLKPEA